MEKTWRNVIRLNFIPKLHRLTLAIDYGGLLSDERLINDLKISGFRIIEVFNPMQLRYEYELVRAQWDSGCVHDDLLLVCNPEVYDAQKIPYDILHTAHQIELSLELLFPKLYQPSVRLLDKRYYDLLLEFAEDESIESVMNERATNLFILRTLFRIHGNELQTDLDVFKMLLRLHYNRISLPEFLIYFLGKYIYTKNYALHWDIFDLLRSPELFWRYVQEVWNAAMIGQVTYHKEGPSVLPFDHSDVLVYLDNAFREGYLHPLVIETDSIHSKLPEALISVGTLQGSEEDLARKQLKDLQEHILTHLPQEAAFFTDWLQFQRRYAQLVRLSTLYGSGDQQRKQVLALRQECNNAFFSWLTNHFDSLLFERGKTPVLVSQIQSYLASKQETQNKLALVVLDGMSYAQWLTIKSGIEKDLPDYTFEESGCFAWIPSLTSVSRQSIFSGLAPRYFGQSIETTQSEEKLWIAAWQKEMPYLSQKEINYFKGLGEGSAEQDLAQIPYSTKYLGLVINSVDTIMHGMTLGELGMHDILRTWLSGKYLVQLLTGLSERGFEVYMTSDHGNLESTGIGMIREGVLAETKGQRVRTYSSKALRDSTVEQYHDRCIAWNSTTLPEGYEVVLAEGHGAFSNQGTRVIAHGGASLDEVIVPFIHVIGKQYEQET
jgi:hypothetical protein